LEFAAKENRSRRRSDEDWLQDHVFSDLHEKFFAEFPILLSEWMLKLKDNNGTWNINVKGEWTLEKIQQLNEISNPISRAVDFWINNILKGYVTEFDITYSKSYSASDREFFSSPRGRYLREVTVWINMALHDCGTLPMKNIESSIMC